MISETYNTGYSYFNSNAERDKIELKHICNCYYLFFSETKLSTNMEKKTIHVHFVSFMITSQKMHDYLSIGPNLKVHLNYI